MYHKYVRSQFGRVSLRGYRLSILDTNKIKGVDHYVPNYYTISIIMSTALKVCIEQMCVYIL